MLRSEDDAPQQGFVLDDADVAVEVGNLRQAVVERDQVAEPVAGFQLVEPHQLVGDGDAVDFLAAFVQLPHAPENAAVLFEAEVLGFQGTGGLHEETIVEEDAAEHETLGVLVDGQTFVDSVLDGH